MNGRTFLLLLLAVPELLTAQDWVNGKKDKIFKLSYETRGYDKVYDNDGNARSSPDLNHNVLSFDAEFAINRSFSVGATVPLVMNSIEADNSFGITSSEKVSEPGDIQLLLRYMIPVGDHILFSAFYQQSLATAETDAVYGMNTGYADYAQLIGGSFSWRTPLRIYTTIDAGYKIRHEGFGDELKATAELGFRMFGPLWIYANSKGVQPLENGDDNKQGGNFGLYEQYMGYWNTGAGIRINMMLWDVYGQITGNFKGQHSPSSAIFEFGARLKFLKDDRD